MFVSGIISLSKDIESNSLGVLMIVFISSLIAPFACLWVCHLSIALGRLFCTYLKVSPTGIEYRHWPSYGLRCKWDDIESLGKRTSLGIFTSDVLLLERVEPIGWQISMTVRRKLGLNPKYFVPLTGIKGWPNGELAEDLQQYAPHLFKEKNSVKQSFQEYKSAG